MGAREKSSILQDAVASRRSDRLLRLYFRSTVLYEDPRALCSARDDEVDVYTYISFFVARELFACCVNCAAVGARWDVCVCIHTCIRCVVTCDLLACCVKRSAVMVEEYVCTFPPSVERTCMIM